MAESSHALAPPSIGRIFAAFLTIGATSLGGGVIAYLRAALVVRLRWLDDLGFVELLSISQTLPGLNATNMSILVGDRLRGTPGAVVALVGMCLPGASLMTAAAFAYHVSGDDPWSRAFLHAVAAGALGLTVFVLTQVGMRALVHRADYAFAAATAIAVAFLDVPVPVALVGVGAVAIWWNRPRQR